jgi:hypothetical protein
VNIESGWSFSTMHVDSILPVSGPMSNALWGCLGGIRNGSPACRVKVDLPLIIIFTVLGQITGEHLIEGRRVHVQLGRGFVTDPGRVLPLEQRRAKRAVP